jgi:hypothetical protein
VKGQHVGAETTATLNDRSAWQAPARVGPNYFRRQQNMSFLGRGKTAVRAAEKRIHVGSYCVEYRLTLFASHAA